MASIKSFSARDHALLTARLQSPGKTFRQSMIEAILSLYFGEEAYKSKVGHCVPLNVTDDFLFRMHPTDIAENERQLSSSLQRFWLNIEEAKRTAKAQCLHDKKNIHIIFFYMDKDISRRLYIASGGYISPLFAQAQIKYADLLEREDMDPAESEQSAPANFRIPAFQLPTMTPETTPSEEVSVSRMISLIRSLAVILNTDEKGALPEGDAFYDFEPELGIVTKQEERQAVRLLIVSICHDQPTVLKVAGDYKQMILACEQVDRSFFARAKAENPEYATCRSIPHMADRCHNTIVSMARHYSQLTLEMPAALRCAVHLY